MISFVRPALRGAMTVACLGLAVMAGPAACDSPKQQSGEPTKPPNTKPSRARGDLGSFEQWELRYEYSGSSPCEYEDAPGVTVTESPRSYSESGFVILEKESLDDGIAKYAGEGLARSSLAEGTVTQRPNRSERSASSGSGTSHPGVILVMDLKAGTYDLDIGTMPFSVSRTGSKTDDDGTVVFPNSTSERTISLPFMAPAYVVFDLPAEGVEISDAWSWERYRAREREVDGDNASSEKCPMRSGTLRWRLTPRKEVPVDLVVEASGYDDWLPEGAATESTPGNTLAVTATLVSKDGEPTDLRAKEVSFELVEVSKEKGVALNLPLSGGLTTPDLGFEAATNGDLMIDDEKQSAKATNGSFETATAVVTAYDWGAFGNLLVTATLEDGRKVTGYLRDDPSVSRVPLPKRSAVSAIGDRWKELVDFEGVDDDDEDVQKGNSKIGDGLTAYEEYRGLIVGGKHTRRATGAKMLDPKRKDVAVLNTVGAKAKPGLELFEKASGIRVLEMTDGELPGSRLLNTNRTTASRGEQYGMKLVDGTLPDSVVGENHPATLLGKTPKLSEQVVVDFAQITATYEAQKAAATAAGTAMPYTLVQDIATTVAHELAHGVGAPHHGRPSDFTGPRQITSAMVDYHAYGVDGVELTDRPLPLQGRIGTAGNDSSGDVNCLMAYTNMYTWATVTKPGGRYDYYAVGLHAPGTTFCTSAAATGTNAPHTVGGKTVPGFFGDAQGQGGNAPVGNCLGAMKVSDWSK